MCSLPRKTGVGIVFKGKIGGCERVAWKALRLRFNDCGKKNPLIVKIFGSFQKSLIKKKRDERRPNIVFEMCSVPRKTGVLFVYVFVFWEYSCWWKVPNLFLYLHIKRWSKCVLSLAKRVLKLCSRAKIGGRERVAWKAPRLGLLDYGKKNPLIVKIFGSFQKSLIKKKTGWA